MSSPTFIKVKAQNAAEICAHFDLDQNAQRLLGEHTAPREFAVILVANKQYAAAIDFMAHALPTREAIWWGCLCLQHACGDSLSRIDRLACKAAVVWVMRPCEETRVMTKAPAESARGYASPAGALALAANQTGGSLAPPNYPSVPPGPYAPAKAVAASIKLSSLKSDPRNMADRRRCYAELGMAIADGRYV